MQPEVSDFCHLSEDLSKAFFEFCSDYSIWLPLTFPIETSINAPQDTCFIHSFSYIISVDIWLRSTYLMEN